MWMPRHRGRRPVDGASHCPGTAAASVAEALPRHRSRSGDAPGYAADHRRSPPFPACRTTHDTSGETPMNPSATRRRNRAVIPVLVGVVAVLAAFARRDYRRWQSLGEGGVPWGLRGWLTVTRLRIAVTGCDTRDVSSYPRGAEHPLLRDLPERSDRPQIAPHPVPHRQTGDGSPAHVMVDLAELFDGQRTFPSPPGIAPPAPQPGRHPDRGRTRLGGVPPAGGPFPPAARDLHADLRPARRRRAGRRGTDSRGDPRQGGLSPPALSSASRPAPAQRPGGSRPAWRPTPRDSLEPTARYRLPMPAHRPRT